MKKAEHADKAQIVEILSRSFENNQSVNYYVKNRQINRVKAIEALMDYSFEMCSLFGDVWLSNDRKACALVLYPQKKRTTLRTILLDIKLIWNVIGLSGIGKALRREREIKARQSKIPMVYLWFIGVDADHQHKGIGSKLLQEVIESAAEQNLPVYLETSTVRNLPLYERFGFKIYDQLQLSYTLYFLKN